MPDFCLHGVTYHVTSQGAGQPLVLLHGFTGSSQNWRPLLPTLIGKFQVITLDIVGHGRTASPPNEGRYHLNKVAADLIAVLDHLHIEQAHLMGYSMGGRLALFTAVHYPQRLHTLILESASPGLAVESERQERVRRDRELADWLEVQGITAFVDRWEQLPLWASQRQLPPETRQTLRQQRLQNNPVGLANSLRGMGTGAQPSLWPDLARLPMPVVLIAGELDEKFVHINRQMAGHIPTVHLNIVPGAGHAVHLERPSAFINLLKTGVYYEK